MIVPRDMFDKTPGTTDKGKDYEVMVTAYLALQMALDDDVVDFHLSSNNKKFGKIDDIVFKVTKQNPKETRGYAIQLKQSCRDKLPIDSLMGTKGNFSLQKYCEDFHETFTDKNYVFINVFFTNRMLNITSSRVESKLDGTNLSVAIVRDDHTDSLLSVSTASACYSFEIISDDEENEEFKMYKEFFENFTLYTNQNDLSGFKSLITEKFKDYYNCGQEASKMFIEFVSHWAIRDGRKPVLNKEVVKLKKAECLLVPYLLMHDLAVSEEKEMQLFKDAILQFDVTVLETNVGRKFNVIGENDVVDAREMTKAAREFELISDSGDEFDNVRKHKTLWYMDRAPLVIDFDKNPDMVLKAVSLCNTKKFILCTAERFNKELLAGLNVFEHLYDLDRCTFSADIVEQCKVSIQGRGLIPLKDILSDSIKSTLTASSVLKMLKGELCAGKNQIKMSEYYVERAVTATMLDRKCLEENDLFVINDKRLLLDGRLGHKIKPIENFLARKSQDEREVILLTDENWSGLENLKIRKPDTCFHQVRFIDDDKLEWINTSGSVNKLIKHRLPFQGSTVEESQLLNSDRPINILCSAPGIGKTSMMQYFYNNYSPEYWVIYIDLKMHCSHFKPNDSLDDILNYVESIGTDSNNSLDLGIKKSFHDNKKVLLLWDALDEVPRR